MSGLWLGICQHYPCRRPTGTRYLVHSFIRPWNLGASAPPRHIFQPILRSLRPFPPLSHSYHHPPPRLPSYCTTPSARLPAPTNKRPRFTASLAFLPMKASTLCLALSGVAQLVACAPAPGGPTARADEISDTTHGDVAPAPRRWSAYPNQDPPTVSQPGGTLPVDVDVLPPLSKHRTPGGAPWPHPNHHEHDHVFEPLDVTSITPPAHPGMPCHHSRSSRERNDMLVVFLAIAFMVVVVVMETWGSIFRR